MKKAKIILTAITVLAIVGGAVAFKAKRTGIVLYSTTGVEFLTYTFQGIPYTTTTAGCEPAGFIGFIGDVAPTFSYGLTTLKPKVQGGAQTINWVTRACRTTVTVITDDGNQ